MEETWKNKLVLTDRERLVLEGVEYVGNFNDEEIAVETNMGFLLLKGNEMHITSLDLEKGHLEVTGFFTGLTFKENKTGGRGKSLLNRLLR